MPDDEKHVTEVIAEAQDAVAEMLNSHWDGEEISKDQVVIHVVMDGGEDDPFIYTASARQASEIMRPDLAKRLAGSMATTGEELLEGIKDRWYFVIKHKTQGYLERRGSSDEPSLHFTDDRDKAARYPSRRSPEAIIDAEVRAGSSAERWEIEEVMN